MLHYETKHPSTASDYNQFNTKDNGRATYLLLVFLCCHCCAENIASKNEITGALLLTTGSNSILYNRPETSNQRNLCHLLIFLLGSNHT